MLALSRCIPAHGGAHEQRLTGATPTIPKRRSPYALVLDTTALPANEAFGNQFRGAEILALLVSAPATPSTQWTIRFSSSSSKHGIGQQDSLWTNPRHPQGHRGKSPRGMRARRHPSSLCNSSAPSSAIPIDFEASMVPAVPQKCREIGKLPGTTTSGFSGDG